MSITATEIRLRIGNRDTGVTIIPWLLDRRLWCIRWPDGMLSPPGNLTRVKEAAIIYARKYWGIGPRAVHHWHVSPAHAEAPPAAATGVAATLTA